MAIAPSGTVTLLFTDLVASTELRVKLGDDEAERVRRTHFEKMREAIRSHDGREVKTIGDAFMVAFSSALQAIECAVAMQRGMQRDNAATEERGEQGLRVGLDAGEVTREDGDYFGTPVIIAKRLCDLADGGQVLVSQLVRRLVGSRGSQTFRELEARTVKGISDDFGLYEVVWEPAARDADSEPSSAIPSLPPILAATERTEFVGRGAELRVLQECWREAQAGARRLLLIAGEPGIGKTRLAAHLGSFAHAEGAAVLHGQCYEEALRPYQPFAEALRHGVLATPSTTLRTQTGVNAGALAQLIPELAERLPHLFGPALAQRSLSNPVGGDPESERYWFFDAVASMLDEIARERPLVLILDDLHWADKPTLQLLTHIMRAPEDVPLLVLGTYRPGDLGRSHPLAEMLADLRRGRGFERVLLEGLSGMDIEAMIATLAREDVPSAVVDRITAQTEGNPFFIQEVLANLRETGAVDDSPERRASRVATSVEEYGIPEGIKEVLGRRLSRLSEPCNDMLAVASVIGREFEFAVLERSSELSVEPLLDVLDEAILANVVGEVSRRSGWYSFAHALTRESLYGELTTARRLRMHRQIGEALEELAAGDEDAFVSELAHHFFEAAWGRGDVDKTVRYLRRAAGSARAVFAYEEAVQQLERALQVLDLQGRPNPETRFELLVALGTTARLTGNSQRTIEAVEAAIRSARELKAPDLLAKAVLALREGYAEQGVRGTDDDYLGLLQEALDGLGEGHNALRARLLGFMAGEYYMSPDAERRLSISEEAVEAARRASDPQALAFVLGVRHYCLRGPEYADQRRAAVEEILALAKKLNSKPLELTGYSSQIEDVLQVGDVEAADGALKARERLAAQMGTHSFVLRTKLLSAMRALLDGRFEDGERLANEALKLGQQSRSRAAFSMFSLQTFLILKEQGRLSEIEEVHRGLVERFGEVAAYRCAFALLECELGHLEAARAEFDRLAGNHFADIPRDTNWILPIVYLAEVCARVEDQDRALDLYDLLLPYRGSNIMAAYSVVSLGPASRYLGLLATTTSRWEEASAHFDESASMCLRMGAKPWLAHTYFDQARMLLVRDAAGDGEDAERLLDQALIIAEPLGMRSLIERVCSLRGVG